VVFEKNRKGKFDCLDGKDDEREEDLRFK